MWTSGTRKAAPGNGLRRQRDARRGEREQDVPNPEGNRARSSRGDWTQLLVPFGSRNPDKWLSTGGRGGISRSQSETRIPVTSEVAGF